MAESDRSQKDSIDRLAKAVDALSQKIGGGGAGGGRGGGPGVAGLATRGLLSGGRAIAGGLSSGLGLGAIPGGGLAGLALGGLKAAADLAVPIVGGGLVQSARGGSFGTGAVGAVNSIAASIPIIGELSGAAGVERVTKGALADLNEATGNVARFAGVGAISPGVRQMLGQQFRRQNVNLEANRQANEVLTNELSFGNGISGVLDTAKTINHMVVRAGYRQHGG